MNHEDTPFLRLVLRGKRFEKHSVPVDVLEEFSRYQSLILDVAKALYFQRHPHRERVPQGFANQFKLRLKDIEPGSAAPVLYREPAVSDAEQVELVLVPDIFEEAQAKLADYIGAISRGEDAPAEFPNEVFWRFKSFGKTLRPDESMEFVLPGQKVGSRYDIETRQKIVRLRNDNYEETIEKIGNVRSVDTRRRTFRIETKAGEMVEGEYQIEYESDLLFAHKAYRAFAVRIEATGLYTSNGELKKVVDITELSLQDDGPDLASRFDELAELKDGWFDGLGVGIETSFLENVRGLMREIVYEHNCYLPRVYPMPEGGIQVEWQLDDWDIEAEFLPHRIISVLAEHRLDGEWEEREISIDAENSAAEIAKFINERSISGENFEGRP